MKESYKHFAGNFLWMFPGPKSSPLFQLLSDRRLPGNQLLGHPSLM